jgi:hypothetical protein
MSASKSLAPVRDHSYVWLEKYFSEGDCKRADQSAPTPAPQRKETISPR